MGIGTATPVNQLTVDGDADFSGKVGIGTGAPGSPLHVVGDASHVVHAENSSTDGLFTFGVYGEMSSVSAGNGSAGVKGVNNAEDAFKAAGVSGEGSGLRGLGVWGWASGSSGLNYGVYGETASPDGFAGYFAGGKNYFGGRVGIGTTAPDTKLHVEGGTDTSPTGGGYLVLGSTTGLNISIDDNEIMARNNGATETLFLNRQGGNVQVPVLEITGGSDLSEQFEINATHVAAEPGMVVCIDPDSAGELAVSRNAYDRTVAGVISGAGGVNPGMLMGQRGSLADGQHPVALTGRVYVWSDASNGAIKPGDLLTTSDTPGHAMKVTDRSRATGAIIGKAMTGLSDRAGLVLVLVSLQ